ncbi:PhzF family phenazine biosynthesis protein [Herbiconiux sp. 11R-BC]|uniref:PhzF family phenazine biosynthesis protein n=1 Tax=Herbiconiux sp. 11R-BC TaxID=3111637 RepID=UPI003BFEB685
MHSLPVDVVSVFTDAGGAFGNPLGLVRSSAQTLGREQEIATALGFSETVFVDELLERDGRAHVTGEHSGDGRVARIRIFTPARELPFAGHPSVGTSWWLAQQGLPVTTLSVPAGDVAVRYDGELTWITGRASWAPEFTWHELDSPAVVEALEAESFTGEHEYAWAWIDEAAGRIRSRMFAPALGIAEDEATGAAAVRITALLGRDLAIDQGAGSRLYTRFLGDETVQVGGRTVPSPAQELSLP